MRVKIKEKNKKLRCEECRGTGVSYLVYNDEYEKLFYIDEKCPVCGGTGRKK